VPTLAGEAAFLRTVVIERPVPGIPKSSLPGDEKTREIAVHLRIQEDVWRLPDWAVGVMTGEEPARVNERAGPHSRAWSVALSGRRRSRFPWGCPRLRTKPCFTPSMPPSL